MKIMKNVLACLLAVALLGTCIVCSAAKSEVTTVSVDSIYLSESGTAPRPLSKVDVGSALNTSSTKYRYFFVYRLSDEQFAKLAEAQSVTLDIEFPLQNTVEYSVTLMQEKYDESIFNSTTDAWGLSGSTATATMDSTTKIASFNVKDAMQDESQIDNLFIFKLLTKKSKNCNVVSSETNPVLKITTVAKTAALEDVKELEVPPEVRADFTLPTTGTRGSTITWESDNAAIAIDGGNATVTRPACSEGNTVVNLKATAVNGEDSATADFTVTVLKSQVVDEETISVEPSLDTFVAKNYPGNLYNETGYLYLNGSGRQNFIQFKADNNAYFTDGTYATLNFYVTSVKSGTSPSLILYGLTGADKTSWAEAMTYTEAESLGLVDPAAESYGTGKYLSTVTSAEISEGEWISIDVTDFMKEQEDGVLSFRFYGAALAQLASRETENSPYIEIRSGDKGAAAADASKISVAKVMAENAQLPVQGANGSTIAWSSDNDAIAVDEQGNAVVTRGEADAVCVLTATVTKGSNVVTKQFSVTVPAVLISLGKVTTDEGSFVTTSLYEGYELGSNQIFTAFYDEAGNLVNVHSGAGTFELASDVKVVKAMLWKLNSIMPVEIQTISAGEQVTE